ncbi:hypothetical protein [Christiangramia sp. SM2212]|uniref:Uncharacterized protein n=1 Tax=Christiangramia sediminicola TaxID=3073267 RepID=A0ABU1ESC3_9FLAO|nr:hypothetical protein [Christiangramia sp. SM2212]MDR5591300.1 hypothetical protein [Christiangramia sp. SM2212]
MKKKIEADLVRIAEKILNEKGTLDAGQLKEMAKDLYEKLTVLAFTEKHLTVEDTTSKPVQAEKPQPQAPKTPSHDEFYPDGTEYNEDYEAITEPNTEKIKDIVAQMPPETEKVDHMMSNINAAPQKPKPAQPKQENQDKSDYRNIGVDYDNLPDFEPVNHVEKNNKPRSLNDRLKKGINIGLNERLAYIKNLFDGNTADYNRVLSQLNTFTSLEEATKFIELVVKPDYNHWEGKENYEERFMAHIENKFSN